MPKYLPFLPPGARKLENYPTYYITAGVAGYEPPRLFKYHAHTDRYCEITGRYARDHLGTEMVSLYLGKRRFHRFVHRLVAEAFLGPCPVGLEVCHDEPDEELRRDPSLVDQHGRIRLRYDTREANRADAIRDGSLVQYPQEYRDRAYQMEAEGKGLKAIADELAVGKTTVSRWLGRRQSVKTKAAKRRRRQLGRFQTCIEPYA